MQGSTRSAFAAAATAGEEPWPMSVGSPMLEETVRQLDDTGLRVLGVEFLASVPTQGVKTTKAC